MVGTVKGSLTAQSTLADIWDAVAMRASALADNIRDGDLDKAAWSKTVRFIEKTAVALRTIEEAERILGV